MHTAMIDGSGNIHLALEYFGMAVVGEL